jgi:oligopeptide transport system ATP-binding protein
VNPEAVAKAPLVEVKGLTVQFPVAARSLRSRTRQLRALERVSIDIMPHEVLGLVGESGCGKTTLGRSIVRFYRPAEGSITFDGQDLSTLKGDRLRHFQRRVQIIFQDPYASLNPRMTVRDIIREPLKAHSDGTRNRQIQRVEELLDLVGLRRESIRMYPHAFSGGQRQRIGIARALALRPDLIVADEPVSALDVSVQAQIVNLLLDVQAELGLTLLFIAHDLAVVRNIANRVAVMYLGKLVELGTRDVVFSAPLHPYTIALLSAAPRPDPAVERTRHRIVLTGDVPSPIDPPSGCRFHTRCPSVMPICPKIEPPYEEADPGHFVACHLVSSPTCTSAPTAGVAVHDTADSEAE